jgi:endonuclease/exonuclease/phosphatase family metal-dependent hydrolase
MVTLIKAPAVFASFIFCSLLAGCDVDSDAGVDQESASTLEVRMQTSAPESKVVTDAVSEVSLVKPVVPLAQLVENTVDLLEPLTFTVVTYNVENLFDADGVAMFDDYKVDSGYTPRKLLTKLQAITNVLKSVDGGDTPEIVLFQELEADFTPESTVEDYDAFLEMHSDTTVANMLDTEWSNDYAGYPASAWLLKALADEGLTGYHVVTAEYRGRGLGSAHTNAIFSTFPIISHRAHPLVLARDIIEAEIEVEGQSLFVYVNHWKSGASNRNLEPVRVENAKVLRSLIDARLVTDPQADIIIAGDLNSHYNHSALFPEMVTGVNDILGSTGRESFNEADLYNLWFELAPEARYSEVWRGRIGSLMHILITRGLYDDSGISYIDGSFNKLVISGINADAIGRPIRWHSTGETGGGVSDHFPVYARFSLGAFEATSALSKGEDVSDFEYPLTVTEFNGDLNLSDGSFLNSLSDGELIPYVGQLYTVDAIVESIRPLRLKVDRRTWPAYYSDPSYIEEDGLPLYIKKHRGHVSLVVQFNFYRGKSQLIVEDILGTW